MKHIFGDLLEGDWDVAMHCANPHQVMGSGVAYFLKKKWPEVYQADLEYDVAPDEKLGNWSCAVLPDKRKVVNLYGQVGVGNNGEPLDRNCRYDYLYDAIFLSCEALTFLESDLKIGVPYKMASDRAGGSWTVVEAILKDIEEKFPVEFVVYQLEEDSGEKAQSSVVIPKENDSYWMPIIDTKMDSGASPPTPEQIQEYRDEKDHDKRINLAYEYLITYEHLYPEDLTEIMNDVHRIDDETNPNIGLFY